MATPLAPRKFVKTLQVKQGMITTGTDDYVDAFDATYTPATSGDWPGSLPATVQAALDQLAGAGGARASADLTGQTAANASVCTYTPGADGTYRIGVYATITAVAIDVLNVQVTYTDETNTARTQTFVPVGLTSANLSAVGASVFPTMDIRVKGGNAITVKTVLAVGGGSITYDVGGTVEKLR